MYGVGNKCKYSYTLFLKKNCSLVVLVRRNSGLFALQVISSLTTDQLRKTENAPNNNKDDKHSFSFNCSMSQSTNFFEWISLHKSEQDKSHSVFCYLTQTPWLIRRLGYKPLEVFALFHGNRANSLRDFDAICKASNSPYITESSRYFDDSMVDLRRGQPFSRI